MGETSVNTKALKKLRLPTSLMIAFLLSTPGLMPQTGNSILGANSGFKIRVPFGNAR
jgi:hypothetical protein